MAAFSSFQTEFKNKSSNEISTAIVSCNHLYGSIQMLGILMDREGGDYLVGDLSGEKLFLSSVASLCCGATYQQSVTFSDFTS